MRSMPRRNRSRWETLAPCLLTGLLAVAVGCSGDEPSSGTAPSAPAKKPTPAAPTTPPPEPVEQSPADLAARGRSIYMANCIACHSQDPSMDGALGPAVMGSSRELLEARVVRGEYPAGYTPKRESRVMIALPHLEPELDALAAFLSGKS